jgi:hypothetical protein
MVLWDYPSSMFARYIFSTSTLLVFECERHQMNFNSFLSRLPSQRAVNEIRHDFEALDASHPSQQWQPCSRLELHLIIISWSSLIHTHKLILSQFEKHRKHICNFFLHHFAIFCGIFLWEFCFFEKLSRGWQYVCKIKGV